VGSNPARGATLTLTSSPQDVLSLRLPFSYREALSLLFLLSCREVLSTLFPLSHRERGGVGKIGANMTLERFGIIKFRGQEVTVLGEDLMPGNFAPEFSVQTLDWTPFHGLADTQGKVRVISAVLSLETETCDRETRRFNLEAAALGKDIAILVISTDLPYTQKRWCGAAGVDQVTVLSDHLETDFGLKYGVLVKEARVLRRAVFVVDRAGKLTYVAYMPALGVEPDYTDVLAAAKAALA
jgi:thiol peroxidase